MTSSNRSIFRFAGPWRGKFTGESPHPPTHIKASDAELWCFLWYPPWINSWVNNPEASYLRCHTALMPSHSNALFAHCHQRYQIAQSTTPWVDRLIKAARIRSIMETQPLLWTVTSQPHLIRWKNSFLIWWWIFKKQSGSPVQPSQIGTICTVSQYFL